MKKIFTSIALLVGSLVFGQNSTLNFDGTDDFVDLGSDVANGIRSIEFWFSPNSTINATSSTQALVYRWQGGTATNQDNIGIYFGSSALGDAGKIVFQRNLGSTVHKVTSNANSWIAGTWYHVAGVIDPQNGMELYIDGVKQQSTNSSTAVAATTSTALHIGSWGSINIRHFDGAIDELRLWNKALSQTDVVINKCTALTASNYSDLQGYWDFEDGQGTQLSDLTSNNYDGTISGATWDSAVVCTNSAANQYSTIKFDGTDDYVNLGTTAANDVRTVDFWFKPQNTINSLSDGQGLVYRWNSANNADNFGVYIGASNLGDNGKIVFQRKIGFTVHKVVSDSNSWTAGVWYHVVGTIDSTNGMALYIDGVLQQSSNPSTEAATVNNDRLHVGNWGTFNNRYFEGEIDEVRLWSRAIDSSEITAAKCAIIDPAVQTGLAGYWTFNEGTGNSTFDRSGIANPSTGTLSSATWMVDVACITTGPQSISTVEFDGTDDYVDLGSSVSNGVRTIDFWFKPKNTISSLTNGQGLVYRWNSGNGGASNANSFGVYIGANNIGDNGKIVFQRNIGFTVHKVVSDASNWTAGNWYHVVATIDSLNGMALYIDGVLQQSTDPSTSPVATDNSRLHVGNWGTYNNRYFEGEIDELRLWSRTLNVNEISMSKCDTLASGIQSNLAGYWPFNDN